MIGIGVVMSYLSGNNNKEIFDKIIGKEIENISFNSDELILKIDGLSVAIVDDGQSCCETRYMTCDDDWGYHVGAILTDIEISAIQEKDCEYDVHEIQTLRIHTTNGVLNVETHNEHNGYYGGFSIVLKIVQ